MPCHEGCLTALLHDDENSDTFLRASKHVEFCVHCQQRLLELSGDQKLLNEVRTTLASDPDDEPAIPHLLSSVVIAIGGTARHAAGHNGASREHASGDTAGGSRGGEHSRSGSSSSSNSVSDNSACDDGDGAECEPVSLDFLSPASHPEMLGRIGRYDIERVIGAGGMGIVLKGFDTELHRVVAIKVLQPHLAHNGAARRRFAREAQSAAAVVHEHVIPIHDVLTDSESPYLVMQFVPGQSLQARVDERGPLEPREILRIARQVAAGLAAAHDQGVVHRDVKPANILLEESVDRVLISDFGLARTVDDATLTRTGVVAGTPHYMSPEQASGQSVDHRSDLFSLGSVIYFMCTGRPPFRAEHALAILSRICSDVHRPVDRVNVDVPAELAEIVDRLLSKNPTDRYRSARHVEQHLEAILLRVQQGRQDRRVQWRRAWRRLRPWVRSAAMAAVVFGICGGLGAWLTWRLHPVNSGSTNRPAMSAAPNTHQLPNDVPKELQTAQLSAFPIVHVPPDTFERDLAEVRQQLQSVDSNWNPPTHSVTNVQLQDDAWSRELADVQAVLKSNEQDSADVQPANSP